MTVKSVSLYILTNAHTKTPADTTMITVSVCPRCGSIGKSDKSSCCGRGGSWFRNCGSVGNANLQHTWYEGIQACKTRTQQPKTVVARQKVFGSSHGGDMTNYKEVKTFTFTSVNTSAPMSDATSVTTSIHTSQNVLISTNDVSNTLMTYSTHTSPSTSMITQECVNILPTTMFITIFFA